jgi:uncharacterized low-complexity protein
MKKRNSILVGLGAAAALLTLPLATGCTTSAKQMRSDRAMMKKKCSNSGTKNCSCNKSASKDKNGKCGENGCGSGSCGGKKKSDGSCGNGKCGKK